MEVFLPRGAKQHWTYSRNETSSQRMETEAPITMVMAIGDQTNRSKKQTAEGAATQYKRRLSSLSRAELLRTEFTVLDFMSFVDYGDGLSLPVEVGVVGSCLEELEKRSVYSAIPNIQYRDQRVGFASDSKTSCERIHGVDVLDNRSSKLHLTELCNELRWEVPGNTLLLCRSEDLNRVLGSWYWLQDSVPGNLLPNIAVMLIEDFMVHTLTRLHQLNGVVDGGVPTFTQFTTLLSSSSHDLNPEYRCQYHNDVEQAWDKPGCARKNAIKYLDIISGCLSSHIAQFKNAVRPDPATIPIPPPALDPTRGMLPRAAHGTTSSSSLTSSQGSTKTSSETSRKTSRKGSRDNHTRLLSPEYFAVPPKSSSSNSDNASDDTTSSRSVSPIVASQRSTSASPHDVPAGEPSSTIPLPPRRPEKSFSRRNCKKVPEKRDNRLHSSAGSTNLTGLHPSRSPTPGEVSASTSGDSCAPRRPRSYNNRGKGSEKGNPGKLSYLTYDGSVTSVKPLPVMGNVEKKKRGTRSGTSTVRPDNVLVPSTMSAAPDNVLVPSAAPDNVLVPSAAPVPSSIPTSAPPGLTLQFNHSAAEPTSQMTPPPGFGPVPQYAALPPGFIVAPLPCRISRAALDDSASSEKYAATRGNSADRTQSVHKPAKKRGRN